MNIVFFGTPEFGAIILEKLVKAGFKPSLVVTQPDKPAGRGRKLLAPAVKIEAEKHGILVLQTDRFPESVLAQLKDTKARLFVLAAFGSILPQAVLDIPRKGALNVHPSLLPKYRGPSPIQEAILQGEQETGVTIILMDREIDHGPILAQREYPNPKPAPYQSETFGSGFQIPNKPHIPMSQITAPELREGLSILGGELLVQTIPKWVAGDIEPAEQDHSKATFTKQFSKKHGRIDWNKKAEYIARQIRAFTPWPGTFTTWQGKNLKVLKANAVSFFGQGQPGTVVAHNSQCAVVAGKDALVLQEVQLQGGKPVSSREFLLGHKNFLGSILG